MKHDITLRIDLDEATSLRPLVEEDAPQLFALVDSNRASLRDWLPWLDLNKTTADSLTFIQKCLDDHAEGKAFQSAIIHNGQIAGMFGSHPIDWTNRSLELGYWLGEAYRGKGLVVRAARAAVDHSFLKLKLNRVAIRCAPGNTKSRAIPGRLGFQHEGVLRQAEWLYDHYVDLVVYSVLASEWIEK